MNGDALPVTRIEQFNQAIRGAVVLMLVAGFSYGFIVSKVVSTESFLLILNTALIWWFKSRDDEKKDAALKSAAAPTTTTVATPGPSTTTVAPEAAKP